VCPKDEMKKRKDPPGYPGDEAILKAFEKRALRPLATFPRSPTISTFTGLADTDVRIVIEAECSSCGPIERNATADLDMIHNASRHTAEAGHVVILNGTVDHPDIERREVFPGIDSERSAEDLQGSAPVGTPVLKLSTNPRK
jgi:hypothetical protein